MFDEYDDGPDLPSGICDACGESCTATMIDFGIGAYEFWGARGVHHDYSPVSPCCEAEVVEGDAKIIRRATRIAKKSHKGGIEPGDKYELVVTRHYRKGGPSWITTKKRLLAKTAQLPLF